MTKLNKIAKGTGTPKVEKPLKGRILPDLKTQRDNELKALRAELEAAKQLLKKTDRSPIKIGKAGGVSVYGLGRFPVTLYKSQWDKLLGMVPEIKAFIKTNESKLAVKE